MRRIRALIGLALTPPEQDNDLSRALKAEIEGLRKMTVGQLRRKHLELFGEESRSNHKEFLFKRIAWRMQAVAEGGLSERTHNSAIKLANDADLWIRAPKNVFEGGPPHKMLFSSISVTVLRPTAL